MYNYNNLNKKMNKINPHYTKFNTYSQKIKTNIKELQELLLDQKNQENNINKIDLVIESLNDTLKQIKAEAINLSNLIVNEEHRNFLEIIGTWIQRNFNNQRLVPILSLVSLSLSCYDHNIDISNEYILSLVECDTVEQLNEKKEELNKEETLTENSILSNVFLASIYSLIVTITNKPELILKNKNLLRHITMISVQIVEIDNVAIYYKKRRLISNYNTIIKEMRKSTDESMRPYLLLISKLIMLLFSKIGYKRPIYRDYMFKKAIPDKLSDIYLAYYQNDNDLIRIFSLYTVFASRTGDHKTFFWTKGIIPTFCQTLEESKDEILLESVSLAVYILTKDSSEIQDDLKEQNNYLILAKKLLVEYSINNNMVLYIVSTLRRIRDDDFYEQMSQELLYTFFALFDYYYIAAKKEVEEYKEKKISLSNLSNQTQFIVLKELIAILGNIVVKNEAHLKPFVEKNYHIILVDLTLTFIMFPKLIKNTIGTLVNLTNDQTIRDNLCRVAAFIQSIYLIFDEYKNNKHIIDYELRLLMNVLKNDIAINTFISGNMIYYLLLFLKDFKNVDIILINTLKIIRSLIVKVKGMEGFCNKLNEFYSLIYNENLKGNKAYQIFLEDMINLINEGKRNEFLEVKIEVINLLAYLANQNSQFKSLIEKSEQLMESLNNLISSNSKNATNSKLISQAIAQLPVEELNMINNKK